MRASGRVRQRPGAAVPGTTGSPLGARATPPSSPKKSPTKKADTSGNVAEDVVMLAAKALTEKRAATLAEHFEHALVCKSAEAELKELGQRAAYVTLLKKEAIVTEDYAGAEAAKAQLDAIRAQAEAAYAQIGDAATASSACLRTNKERRRRRRRPTRARSRQRRQAAVGTRRRRRSARP